MASQPIDTTPGTPSRRGFLGRIAAGLTGLGAGSLLTGFAQGGDKGQMYGPVRHATVALALPVDSHGVALLGRSASGEIIERAWAIGHAGRGSRGQIVLVLVDGETGGHAELEVWGRGRGDAGALAVTDLTSIWLPGASVVAAPPHLERIAARIAVIIRKHEGQALRDRVLPIRFGDDLA